MQPIEILVLYYSGGGSVKSLAKFIARGINSVDGVIARVRTVPQIHAEKEDIESSHPYVMLSDLSECKALALGSPVYFGGMSAHLKYFLDSTSTTWLTGKLINKPACVFTSSASMHGGQEACLLSMMLPLMHHGMILVGIPYSEPSLISTTTGGTPYGVTHVAGDNDEKNISIDEKNLAINQGKRLAEITLLLNQNKGYIK